MPIIGYFMEPEDFEKLRKINKDLFGDGSLLTPDKRRDLANLMSLVLAESTPLKDGDINL